MKPATIIYTDGRTPPRQVAGRRERRWCCCGSYLGRLDLAGAIVE
jgi:hypothetical protein